MDVRMPDGTVIQNVPEGTTQSELNARFQKFQSMSAPPAEPAPQQPERTPLQEAGRQIGLSARSVINAVNGIPEMAQDAGVSLRNMAEQGVNRIAPNVADAIYSVNRKIAGAVPEGMARDVVSAVLPQDRGAPYEMASAQNQRALNSILPKPETATEKVTGFIQTLLAGSKIPAPQAAEQAPVGFVKSDPAATVKNATLQEAQKAGYVVPPASNNPSILNKAAEGISGKIQTAQQAAVRNQEVTNRLAKQALGLANDAPLTAESLSSLRETAGKVYQQVASAGKITADGQYLDDLAQLGKGIDEITKDFPDANVGARQQIDKLVNSLLRDSFDSSSARKYMRQLRADASANLTAAARSPDPEKQALGMAQREAAATLEDLVGRHLAESGQPELAKSFQQARQLIAASHTVENALNSATGNVSATKIANQLKGKPYGGDLKVAANFAQAFPKAAKEINESMPGISPLDYYGSVGAAGIFNSPHLLMLPALRMAIREALLSPFGQKAAVKTAEAAQAAPTTIGLTGGAALATSSELRQ